ncbi:MAG: MotA/TolQ/ExbB proton channel family protein [Bacteroidales bacterium]|jgi:biopolymer transport protein ExbB|nr:MotA/TolQ/ExbB proton channel family protein [Bacteroidales bacterium]MBR5352801.1 MotA/TolQ/ExbB proton channel family protein [Bacteroidales bacterium]
MKKVIALMSIIGLLTFTNLNGVMAQDNAAQADQPATEQIDQQAADSAVAEAPVAEEPETVAAPEEETKSFHQMLKEKYIQGGAGWMTPVLLCLIFGMALVIERILYLNMANTNVQKLLEGIEGYVQKGDYKGAKDLCRDTRGPVASIFYQGLDRIDEGLDNVEKAVTSYGGVQMARLENNMTWIGLFIALAPSFGFLGTVVGMVQAFDDIEVAGDISPTVVAGGMKVALLTTIFGLIVAIILQIFYNYILTKIESLVAQMEDGSITFMDILVKNKK